MSGAHSRANGVGHRLAQARALTRLGTALVTSVLVAWLLPAHVSFEMRAVAAWDGFALVVLALTWLSILTLRPEQIRTLAQVEDPSRLLALVVVVLGACASLLAVVGLLQGSVTMGRSEKILAISLALSAVATAWLVIHTVFTLRYAHQFYGSRDTTPALDFPGDGSPPDYLDFAYFAFVVGMTAQTADVNIQSRAVRRTALLHGIVSFAFNTAVVALSIGVLTTLL